MTLNPFKYSGPMDECQEYIWDKICRQEYIKGENDCSNKCYQLWFWWTCCYPGEPYRIYITEDYSHAQVQWGFKGFYDPTHGTKIEAKKLFKLKVANEAKKLPSGVKFGTFIGLEYMLRSSQFTMTQKQYDTMLNDIIRHGWKIKLELEPKII